MRILVTGGAGFIGSHVAAAYARCGHDVLIIDNLSTGKKENVPPEAQFIEADLLDQGKLDNLFAGFRPEIINHHAAQTSVRLSWDDPLHDARSNVLASLNLLQRAVQWQTKRIIYASSGGAIYGEPDTLPVSEEHAVRPISNYGVSKYTVELYLRTFGEAARLTYVALRYPNVYGPRQDPHGEAGVVAIFSKQMLTGTQPRIFGDGTKTRDYVYVDDIVDANVRALVLRENVIVNLGWRREITDLEVFRTVQEAAGSTADPVFEQKRPGEIDHICLDATRAHQLLGWKPQITFRQGVQQVVDYWRRQPGGSSKR